MPFSQIFPPSHIQLFCDPMDWGLPGSSVYGILQSRILEWVALPFCRGSFQLRLRTQYHHP